MWLTPEALSSWQAPRRKTRGGQHRYSDLAIKTALTLGLVFGLRLRQTEGLLGFLLALMGLDLAVPDHTTVSRRAQTRQAPNRRPDRQVPAHGSAGEEAKEQAAPAERQARTAKRRANRGALPAHLPRVETVVDIDDHACPCCRSDLHKIGEDVSERLDIVPAQLRVIVVRRPRYACRACEDVVMQAPAPARLIEGGLRTEATIAQVLVSKYADHLPLYRQAQIWARQGINLDRSTLADWVGRAAWHLRPVHERLLAKLKTSPKLFANERTAPVLDPGRGKTKTGQLWAYARDDRPWDGDDPPGVAYVYAPDRKAERPIAHLDGFSGILQVEGYGGMGGAILLPQQRQRHPLALQLPGDQRKVRFAQVLRRTTGTAKQQPLKRRVVVARRQRPA